MPWEETEENIRSGHGTPSSLDPDSFRTINIDRDRGIEAVVGCPRGQYKNGRCQVGMKVQSYLFSKLKGWTMDRAKAWFRKHEQTGSLAGSIEVPYFASYEPFEEGNRRFARIFVLDDDLNRARWGVTLEGARRAAPTLFQAQLLGPPPPGEKGEVVIPSGLHKGSWTNVGKFDQVLINSATKGIAEITRDHAWKNIKSKKWKAVSPMIMMTDEPIKFDDGTVAEDFYYKHVLFVDRGAFPEAGVEAIAEGDKEYCTLSLALAARFDGHTGMGSDPSRLMTDGASSTLVGPQDADKILKKSSEGDPLTCEELAAAWLPESMTQGDLDDGDFAWLSDAYKKGDESATAGRKLPYKIHGKVNGAGWVAAIQAASGAHGGTDFAGGPSKEEVLRKLCRDKPEGVESAVCDELGGSIMSDENKEGSQGKPKDEKKESEQQKIEIQLDDKAAAVIKELQGKLEEIGKQNVELKQWRDNTLAAAHDTKLNEVVDLRIKGGLCKAEDRAKALETFGKMSDEALELMKADLTKQVGILAAAAPAKAKAKLEGAHGAESALGFTVGRYNTHEKKWEV
ncbi:MAG: hypothetical protein V1857_06260 [archaeon]